ncbi:sugar phosphate isomerase/epimerase [Candidatus Woesearchaeota archaeon]|nr:sugar phosphate isomerase/epimerase [Candidatus Woesearchaeota archaeon]
MIFVSTTSLKEHSDAVETVKRLVDAGIKNIELGADHTHSGDIDELISMKKEFGLNYTAHTIFPPAERKFFINIASSDKAILKRSIKITKNSIDFCRRADAELYSMHGGFNCDIDINSNRISDFTPLDECMRIMKDSLTKVAEYAKEHGISIAVENNTPLFEFNLITRPTHIAGLVKELNLSNVGLLVDVGHLNVASKLEGFDKREEIEKVKEHILELHIHENDGIKDEHRPLSDSRMLDFLPKEVLKKAIKTLEGFRNWDIKDVKKSMEIISRLT